MWRKSIALAIMATLPHSGGAVGGERIKVKSAKQLKMEGVQRQTLDYSCGAASLAILLQHYFGESYSEEELLTDITLRLSPEELKERVTQGFSMLDLKRAAARLGFSAEGVMLPSEAVSALKGPVIILLRREGLNHFVVLKGESGGRAFLVDPARGHLRMPLYAFFEQWRGEALIVGRDGFGLPIWHALSPPTGRAVAPEAETVRALQYIPSN